MRQIQRQKTLSKADSFTESVIRVTIVALQHGAVKLAQEFPDFPYPPTLKQAAYQAIADESNQYAIIWGDCPFRYAIAEKARCYLGLDIDTHKTTQMQAS